MKTAVRLGEVFTTPVVDILRSMINLSLKHLEGAEVMRQKMTNEVFVQEYQVLEIKVPRRCGKTTAIIALCQELDNVLVLGKYIEPKPYLYNDGAKEVVCLNSNGLLGLNFKTGTFDFFDFIIVENAAILKEEEKKGIIEMLVKSDQPNNKLLIFIG